jgi:hypothetical protein
MAQRNTNYIHGSIPRPGDWGEYMEISSNITWGLNYFPYGRPGFTKDNATHLGCISKNATLLELCCSSFEGSYYIPSGNNRPTENVTDDRGISQWCMLPDTNDYNDHNNPQPALVTSFAECYNRTVVPANNPGDYKGNVTVNSDIWRCDLAGNYTGSNSYEYPSRAQVVNGAEQAGGRFSVLAVAGLVSLFALKASIGI